MDRMNKAIENMQKNGIDQMLVTTTSDIFYLTGEWIDPGERFLGLLLNSNGDKKLFINKLFPVKTKNIKSFIYEDKENPIEIFSSHINKNKRLGIDKNWSAKFLIELMEKINIKVFNSSKVIEGMRVIKDAEEINKMRLSSQINDKAMKEVQKLIPNMMTEKMVARAVSNILEKLGAEGNSFEPIIAYGENAGEPHHISDKTKIKHGDSVIIDMGGVKDFYCSDMTRTIFFGAPKDEYKKIYNIVLEANLKGIEAVKPGNKFSDVDNAARSVIEKAGYGEYFTHRTGHNIGIDVHEWPNVSSDNDMELKPGMIFSVEPGIYLNGKVGVRIEDLVLVTKNGCEVLNSFDKSFNII
ncbi:proline dipeptidase [Tepiditoga spiralis]|uniref:Proline dipeptidase n=1 Tax=Tepiditoga spiralis TaxID=2108365 RepID=A0A7G1G3F3_9BACT|nr:Xaa-Pro peptidase family protein [Tepiditoga spiralis]BBE30948.1 proline dipeptidase [Tepiditoga spiralis]